MINKEQQIKNSFIYLVPTIIGNLLPIITLPIFTRILTKEDYGILALASLYAIFASGLANFGLIVGYERNFFQYKDKKKTAELLYSTLAFVGVSFLIFAILTYFFKGHFSKWIIGSIDYANILFWAYCATAVASFKNYYLTYFKNTENAKAFVWYTIDETALGIIFSLFMVAYLRIGVIGLIWGQLFASLIILSILSIKFLKVLPVSFNLKTLGDSLRISYPLTPRIFLGVANTQFDKYIIRLLNSVGGVGIYSIGQRIASLVFSYMTAIQNVFNPQIYNMMFNLKEKGKEAVGKYLTPFAYISIAIALLVALFSEEVISILTPKSYHEAIPVIAILSMYYGFLFFGKINGTQLIFMKKTHITSVLTIWTIGLNIGLTIPFIIKFGVIGVAWAMFLAGLISGSISFIVAQHYYRIKWEYKKIVPIFLIFFASSILVIIPKNFFIDYPIRLLLKLGFLVSYSYLGIKIKVITWEHYKSVRDIVLFKRTAFFQAS